MSCFLMLKNSNAETEYKKAYAKNNVNIRKRPNKKVSQWDYYITDRQLQELRN